MAQRSKRARYHAQVKRELSLAKRALMQQEAERVRSTSIVLLLLSRLGGDVTIDGQLVKDVSAQIPFMGYEANITTEGEFRVKIVVNEQAMAEAMEMARARAESDLKPMGVPTPEPGIVLTDGE